MQHPEDIVNAWTQAWNNADADALAALFTPDADFVNVVGLWWTNRDDIRKAHDYGFRQIFPESKFTPIKTRVRDLGTTTVVHLRWQLHGQIAPDGSAAGVRNGIFIFVMERFAENWLCVAAQNTDIHSGAETLLVDGAGAAPVDYRPSLT